MTCHACGGGHTSLKLGKRGVEILGCDDCGLAWWSPPDDFRPEEIYDSSYFANHRVEHGYDDYEALSSSLGRTFARRISRLRRPGDRARLLDIGAAYGFAVSEASRAGWDAYGIEISTSAARRAARETSGRIAIATGSETPFPRETFDAITLWDVLEHLPNPRALLEETCRLLRPGGRLVLTTGDVGSLMARVSGAAWHLYTLPEHLFFFSRPSLALLLRQSGFVVEEMCSEAAYYTLGYLVERLRKTLLGHSGRGRPSWPGAGIGVPLNLFDIVRVTARRA